MYFLVLFGTHFTDNVHCIGLITVYGASASLKKSNDKEMFLYKGSFYKLALTLLTLQMSFVFFIQEFFEVY